MQPRDYLRIARRRWLSIVLCAVLGALVGFGVSTQLTPEYESSSGVFISTTPSDGTDALAGGQFSQQRVTSYADVVGGLELAQRVIDRMDLQGITAEELSEEIRVTTSPDSVVLRISVVDPDPQRAEAVNENVLVVLQDFVAELETPPGEDQPLLKATVTDPPRLADAPVSPQPLRNTGLGLVVGLVIGLGAAAVRELLDRSVRDVADVPELAEVPLLSTLAYDSSVKRSPLVSTLPSHAPRAEAFRVLATNLSFVDIDQDSKVLVVTSSIPSEGKSTTAVNAALTLSAAGSNVLLVDGDLRRPQVAALLGMEPSVGVTTVLLGNAELDDVMQHHDQSGLDVLAAGQVPPNPAELLQSRAMERLLEVLRTRYDIVVVDAPPLLPVTDAALLAAQADGAVVVVKHSSTSREQAGAAVRRLEAVGARPMGVVLNMVRARKGARSESYGYGYSYGPTG